MPRQFREFTPSRGREKWPLEFDLSGVERNSEVRQQLKQQEQLMPQAPSNNRFVSGASIDINRPPQAPYNPNDPKNKYPKMLYHPTKKDQNWSREHQRIELHNKLHPERPEILPEVPAAFIVVKNHDEEAKAMKDGFGARAPHVEPETEDFDADMDKGLCSRGCGLPPHRGSCKKNTVAPEMTAA